MCVPISGHFVCAQGLRNQTGPVTDQDAPRCADETQGPHVSQVRLIYMMAYDCNGLAAKRAPYKEEEAPYLAKCREAHSARHAP